jgi:integrase/recombinase XerC
MTELALLPHGFKLLGGETKDIAILASNDVEAVTTWLQAKGGRNRNTFDAYRREATRLLIWLESRDLPLAKVTVDDVHDYYAHLANPPASWIRPRKFKHTDQPLPSQLLVGALSSQSIAFTRTVLSQLYAYLRDAGYVHRNPLALSIKPPTLVQTTTTRLLDVATWQWLWQWLKSGLTHTRLQQAHASRYRWILALLYHTGLRRQEVADGRMGDFLHSNGYWSLRVVGKGQKERFATINRALLEELQIYRQAMSLTPLPTPGEVFPLVGSVQGARQLEKLTARSIGLIVHEIACHASLACNDPHMKTRLQNMSTHWLRHTNGSHRLLAGALTETTQDEMGHADLRTTRLYIKTGYQTRIDDAEKLAALHLATTLEPL